MLGEAVQRREQVLRVVFVVHLLETRRAQEGEQHGHDDEVAGVAADAHAQAVEPPLQASVDETATHRNLRTGDTHEVHFDELVDDDPESLIESTDSSYFSPIVNAR